jgi:hypothetical protein
LALGGVHPLDRLFSSSSFSLYFIFHGTKRLSCLLVPIYKHRIHTFLKIAVYFHRDISVSVLPLCCSPCYMWHCTRFFLFTFSSVYINISSLHIHIHFPHTPDVTRMRQMLNFFRRLSHNNNVTVTLRTN